MSCVTAKALWPKKRVKNLQAFSNARGFGHIVWDAVCEQYLGVSLFRLADDKLLWALWKDERLPLHQRAVLAMTYDYVMIRKADYAQAAADLRAWLVDFPPDSVNHLEEIAQLFESDPDCPAVGFHQVSTTNDPWKGPWNEKRKRFDKVDWSNKWDLYQGLRDPAFT